MLKDPSVRYRPFTSVELPDRRWPAQRLERPPEWVSTDLRDGNQALFEPMNMERKLRFFHALVAAGFKQIEVAFPASSEIEFAFVRMLIEENLIPPDVTIEVMTQAREHLIERTIESLAGAPRAIVHLYNATAPAFRRIVFDQGKQGVMDIAVRSTARIRQLTQQRPDTEWTFQYSPETFSATELDFSKEICDAVARTWGPTRERKMIVNLPATVEIGTPNHYADQIEWMHRNLANRDCLVLSVHPHNDRGTAVAAAELAVMAGAERVEGCLFGNGERTGNVDLVSLALNFYSQGISPGLDFSDIDEVARTVEYCNQLPVHPRHPYAGDLVFTAFSGSHQDAIKKGMQAQSPIGLWEVPYLPVDPADLGRTYDSIIRVNSQSGKGGISYLLEREHGLVMPRRLQVEFSSVVQAHCDAQGTEIDSGDLWRLFRETYLESAGPFKYISHRLTEHREGQGIELVVEREGARRTLVGVGNGPIDAAVHALDVPLRVNSFEEHSAAPGASARAFAMVETGMAGQPGFRFGVGLHENTVTASIAATISAANRWLGNR